MERWSDISDSRGGGVDGVDGDAVEPGSSPIFPNGWPLYEHVWPTDGDDVYPDEEEVYVEPKWELEPTWCSAGSWVTETSGGGEAIGHYGLLTGAWGFPWNGPSEGKRQMLRYLRSTPCHILCLQEAGEDLMTELAGRASSKFMGVRGSEPGSLAIFARTSVVCGIRLLVFHRTLDGTFTVANKKQGSRKVSRKYAMSRIMIASAKMRHFRIRGGGADGDEDEDIDEITICNVHLHPKTAKRDLSEGGRVYHSFWDQLAQHLATFRPRFLCGVFNVALFAVVPELRARGFQVSVAAWQCWQNNLERNLTTDTSAIFRVGPCKGIRMCFDASVFGFTSPKLPTTCSMVMEKLRDPKGKAIGKRKYLAPNVYSRCHGIPLTSYHPREPQRRERFVLNTFTPVFDEDSPAVAEMKACAINKELFPFGVDTSTGSFSWSLPEDVPSKQKLADAREFDPDGQLLNQGIHAPLMIFMGAGIKRKPEKKERKGKADNRGWEPRARAVTI